MSKLVTIEPNKEDLEKITSRLDELAQKGANMSKMMSAISQTMRTRTILDNFDKESDPSGKRWEPLQESTIKRRRNKSKNIKILTDTSMLRNSIKSSSSNIEASISTNTKYAMTHQFGLKSINKKGKSINVNIPARPFFGFSRNMIESIMNLVTDYFLSKK